MMRITHKWLAMPSLAFCLCLTFSLAALAQNTNAVDIETIQAPLLKSLIQQAKTEASQDYEAPEQIDNDAIEDMSYSQYRAIYFKDEEAIWRGQRPFEVQLFHTGFLYQVPVNIHIIDWQNKVNDLSFDSKRFTYEEPAKPLVPQIEGDIGHSGFRVHYPINNKHKTEFAVFQGATYFRLVGKNQIYGISSRALAIDTGLSEGEEFPYFTDFWLVETDSDAFTVYAKINSPSVTGVFRFILKPGVNTHTDIEAWVFAREDITKLGLAPLTSMYLYGENTRNKPDDYRPEVHDSDGLLLAIDDQDQIWRPLTKPDRLRIGTLTANKIDGFGLLQRDIQYSHYLDDEANYHMRPGMWVNTEKGFEKGRLELIELPTNSETHDNIVAFWVNDKGLSAGDSLHLKYDIQTTSGEFTKGELFHVIRTLQGDVRLPGEEADEDDLRRRFIVDYSVPRSLDINTDKLKVEISATNATIEQTIVKRTNMRSEIRVTFIVNPATPESVVDMRLHLSKDDVAITEVWNYVYE